MNAASGRVAQLIDDSKSRFFNLEDSAVNWIEKHPYIDAAVGTGMSLTALVMLKGKAASVEKLLPEAEILLEKSAPTLRLASPRNTQNSWERLFPFLTRISGQPPRIQHYDQTSILGQSIKRLSESVIPLRVIQNSGNETKGYSGVLSSLGSGVIVKEGWTGCYNCASDL